MGYLSDWQQAEREAQAVRDAHPDCTGNRGCPAADHVLECAQYRHTRTLRQLGEARRRVAELEAAIGHHETTKRRDLTGDQIDVADEALWSVLQPSKTSGGS